jgi:hypothetical protein
VESFASVAFRVVGSGTLATTLAGFMLAMLYMRLAVVGRPRVSIDTAIRRLERDAQVAQRRRRGGPRRRPA